MAIRLTPSADQRPRTISVFACLLAIVLFKGASYYNSDTILYGVRLMARFNPQLYTTDFTAQSAAETITPQIVSDLLAMGLMTTGMPFSLALWLMYLLCCVGLVLGFVRLLKSLSVNHPYACGALLAIGFSNALWGHGLGGSILWIQSYLNQSPAVVLFVWSLAIAFAKNPRWYLAFLVLGYQYIRRIIQ